MYFYWLFKEKIRDDLNYFITNKHDREKVTLFNLPLGGFTKSTNSKLKELSAQGEFNLASIEYFPSIYQNI